MAERIGIVTGTEKGFARVAIPRAGGCGACATNLQAQSRFPDRDGGPTCAGASTMTESRAANPVGARSGDMVRVHMDTVNLFKGAAVIYLLPIAFMLLGALAFTFASSALGWQANAGAIAGSLIGLFLGLAMLVKLERAGRIGRKWTPTIKQVIPPWEQPGLHRHGQNCGH
jgi:sigma-E factor negative regulatory protein RseC